METSFSRNESSTVVLKSDTRVLRHVAHFIGLEPDREGNWDRRHYVLDAEDADLSDDVDTDQDSSD